MLCSGNGDYEKGVCVCHAGWKGAECEVEEGQCIDPTCSNNGECVNGVCVCAPAFKGDNCEQGTAPSPPHPPTHTHTHTHTLFIQTCSAFDGLDSFLDRKIEFEAQRNNPHLQHDHHAVCERVCASKATILSPRLVYDECPVIGF